jgi:hypothetical protein
VLMIESAAVIVHTVFEFTIFVTAMRKVCCEAAVLFL